MTRLDTPERPWETCNACNYDKHVCKGCGEPTTHAQGFVCPACSSECKHEMQKIGCADCRGLGEVADPLEGLLIDRFLQSAKYPGKCAVDPAHGWDAGEPIGLAVYDNEAGRPPFKKLGWVCHSCRTGITYPESRRG